MEQPIVGLPSGSTSLAGQGTSNGNNVVFTSTGNGNEGSLKDIPRDARIVGLLLASLGATDAEPGVVAMLLEFAHRYTLEILQSAQVYAEHAQRPRDGNNNTSIAPLLEIDDLRLAVSSKLEHSYSSALPKEFLMPLAAQINRVPLPILPESYGIRLPPERERLTAVNWDLLPLVERRSYPEIMEEQQQPKASSVVTNGVLNGNEAGMDIDVNGEDLFGGQDNDEDEDAEEDEEDEEDMEEVVDPSLQNITEQDQDQEPDEDEDDAEAEAEGDGDGEENDIEIENDNEGDENAEGREEDDDYDV